MPPLLRVPLAEQQATHAAPGLLRGILQLVASPPHFLLPTALEGDPHSAPPWPPPSLTASWRQPAPPPRMLAAAQLPTPLPPQMLMPLLAAAPQAVAEQPPGGAAAVTLAPAAGRCRHSTHAEGRWLGCGMDVGAGAVRQSQHAIRAAAWIRGSRLIRPAPLHRSMDGHIQVRQQPSRSSTRPQAGAEQRQRKRQEGRGAVEASTIVASTVGTPESTIATAGCSSSRSAAPPISCRPTCTHPARGAGQFANKPAPAFDSAQAQTVGNQKAGRLQAPTSAIRCATPLVEASSGLPPTRARASSTLTANAANSSTSLTTTTAATREQ